MFIPFSMIWYLESRESFHMAEMASKSLMVIVIVQLIDHMTSYYVFTVTKCLSCAS